MKQYWQWEQEALERIGWADAIGNRDRARAVDVVIDLMKENERLKTVKEREK